MNSPVPLEKMTYEAIKEAILTFALKPGQPLVENDLASQLNISKTPVRDALLRLEKEGLVEKIPYKGAFVTEVNQRTMHEIFEIRAVLEGMGVRLAIPNITPDDLKKLHQILDRHALAVKNGRIDEASDLNRKFHELIVERSSNLWLKQILSNLEDHLRRYRLLSNYQAGRLDKSIQEHERILKAIENGDGFEAEAGMKDHLISVVNDLSTEDFDTLVSQITHKN